MQLKSSKYRSAKRRRGFIDCVTFVSKYSQKQIASNMVDGDGIILDCNLLSLDNNRSVERITNPLEMDVRVRS